METINKEKVSEDTVTTEAAFLINGTTGLIERGKI
jgi:hypothetical protein